MSSYKLTTWCQSAHKFSENSTISSYKLASHYCFCTQVINKDFDQDSTKDEAQKPAREFSSVAQVDTCTPVNTGWVQQATNKTLFTNIQPIFPLWYYERMSETFLMASLLHACIPFLHQSSHHEKWSHLAMACFYGPMLHPEYHSLHSE